MLLLAYVVSGALLAPFAVSALCGTVIPFLVDLVTKSRASRTLKGAVALALSALAGALATVTLLPGESWADYVTAITMAFLSTIAVHSTGVSEGVQRSTAQVGIGRPRRSPSSARRRPHTDAGLVLVGLLAVAVALVAGSLTWLG